MAPRYKSNRGAGSGAELAANDGPRARAEIIKADGTRERVEITLPAAPPKFLRLPPPGTNCPVSGLSRAYLNGLILDTPANGFKAPVKSYVIKARPDCRSGVRLVDASSLFEFIAAHPANGEGGCA